MSKNYLDCISPQELDRLKAQHDAWLPETHSFLKDMGFSGFESIADFGCGPGFTAFDLATLINSRAQVTALDVSDYYLKHVRRRAEEEGVLNLKVIQQNAAKDLHMSGIFEAAFCRWFLAWVTSDIETVLKNIHKSLKPGGTFAAMEYLTLKSTVYSPPCAALSNYLKAWEDFYSETGGTTEVGAMLPRIISNAGFKIIETRCVGGFAPAGHRIFNWWKRLYEEFRAKFLEKGLLKEEEIEEMNRYWENGGKNENAFIFSPILIQIAAVKQ